MIKKHNKNNEYHLIKMNDDVNSYDNNKNEIFDYKSIHSYKSIYKFSNSLHKHDIQTIFGETKPLKSSEKWINYTILGAFYFLLIIFLPFSLFVCLKHVKKNEKFVVYRLGRLIKPAYESGYYILFPLIDQYQRYTVTQKEFTLPNLQIFTNDNGVVEITTQINYFINDVIKVENTLQNLNHSIKSLTRSLLIENVSKKSASKIEMELYYIKDEVKRQLNENVRKWGVEVSDVEIITNSVVEDESTKNGDDSALKSLQLVFKSLFSGSSSTQQTTPTMTPTSMLLQFMQPNVETESSIEQIETPKQQQQQQGLITPEQLLTIIQPLINEKLVNEIQTLYEFHIKNENDDQIKKFYINLKYNNGSVGHGNYLIENSNAKIDCIIKVNEVDLNEILLEKLTPFNAYMSGRIEIDGNLTDVLKLKKILTSSIQLNNNI